MECGAESDELAQGWRAYLAPEEDDESEADVLMFFSGCAEREFGPSGWEDNALAEGLGGDFGRTCRPQRRSRSVHPRSIPLAA